MSIKKPAVTKSQNMTLSRDFSPSCVAIYVTSFDGYEDLWSPFFECFWDNWPDCPFKVYLGGNEKGFCDDRVVFLKAGNGKCWSDRVKEHLSEINEEYVVMFLEDWFLTKKVDTENILHLMSMMSRLDGKMLRLVPDPRPDYSVGGCPEFGLMGLGTINRTNTHATVWDKNTLLGLLRSGESLWEFEVYGAARSNCLSGGVYCVWQRSMHYLGAVDAGKFTRNAVRVFTRRNVTLDLSRRDVKGMSETFSWRIRNFVTNLMRLFLPARLRQKLRGTISGPNAYQLRR